MAHVLVGWDTALVCGGSLGGYIWVETRDLDLT